MIGGSDCIQLFQMVKTNYIDILWCHKDLFQNINNYL